MQDSMIYQREPQGEGAGYIKEKQTDYASLLGAQTEEYIRHLRDFEDRCARPGADREKLQAEITLLNESMLDACAEFERNCTDPFIVKATQVEFRVKTNPILSKSYGFNRTRTWPQGHQGDYNTLEMGYKNTPMSGGIGFYLDKYLLAAPISQAVRERIVKLRDLVKEELGSRISPKVLDVACGSCREVFELANDIKASRAKFVCIDLDEDALTYALDRFTLVGLDERYVEMRKYNALRLFDLETARAEFGHQDVIYSVGYFDYLPDDFLVKMLSALYKLLTPGGKLIASFKDVNRYRPQLYHWLVNWDGFLNRTEDDFERILHYAEIPENCLSSSRVESGPVIFYTAVKK